MTKREQWRAKAARYLRWHREARRSKYPASAAYLLRMHGEAKHHADYWQRHGENARAPSWYYPD